jgi:tetratricopeptide (TPR) repeat protein
MVPNQKSEMNCMGEMTLQQAFELGMRHFNAGDFPQAESVARQILAHQPDNADAMHLLALVLLQTHRTEGSVDLIGRAIAIYSNQPAAQTDLAECYSNLGVARAKLKQMDQAIAAYRQSLKLRPGSAAGHNNLGNALQIKGDFDAAVEEFRTVLAIQPGHPDASVNLGNILHGRNELGAAAALFNQALALHPDHAPLHWNLSLILLVQGKLEQGWAEYEWRLKVPEFKPAFPQFAQPRWDGNRLNSKRILIHTEQGFGDVIHFARYIPIVLERGGKVILAAQPNLLRLLQSISGIEEFVAANEPLPSFDVHCPLLSLPYTLGMNAPYWNGPYLKADPALQNKFLDVLQPNGKMKVGLVWSGRAFPEGRSIPLAQLVPLAHPNIQFYSLQWGKGAAEIKNLPAGFDLIDATDRLQNFADTAALMSGLDLIVSIDTAAPQLSGALGKQTRTLLKLYPDWRWYPDRLDSLWYPTMKLYRQCAPDDWSVPVSKLAAELHILAQQFKGF